MNTVTFQNSEFIDLLSAQGTSAASGWKSQGKISKKFDDIIKANSFHLNGNNETKLQYTKHSRLSAYNQQFSNAQFISQRYLILQIMIPSSRTMCIELGFHDHEKNRRRLIISSAFRELGVNSLHAQLPLGDNVTRDQWRNLVFDLGYLVKKTFDPRDELSTCYKALESIAICGSCRLRRVFMMKYAPTPDLKGIAPADLEEDKFHDIPRQFALFCHKEPPGYRDVSSDRIKCTAKQLHTVIVEYYLLSHFEDLHDKEHKSCKPQSAPKENGRNTKGRSSTNTRRISSEQTKGARKSRRNSQKMTFVEAWDKDTRSPSANPNTMIDMADTKNTTRNGNSEIRTISSNVAVESAHAVIAATTPLAAESFETSKSDPICSKNNSSENVCQTFENEVEDASILTHREKRNTIEAIEQKLDELTVRSSRQELMGIFSINDFQLEGGNIITDSIESNANMSRSVSNVTHDSQAPLKTSLTNHLRFLSEELLQEEPRLSFDDIPACLELVPSARDSSPKSNLFVPSDVILGDSSSTEKSVQLPQPSSPSDPVRKSMSSLSIKTDDLRQSDGHTREVSHATRSGSESPDSSGEELSIDIALDLTKSSDDEDKPQHTAQKGALSAGRDEIDDITPERPTTYTMSPTCAAENHSTNDRLNNLLESTDWSTLNQMEHRILQTHSPSTIIADNSIQLIYDPILRCYHDPTDGRYYTLK